MGGMTTPSPTAAVFLSLHAPFKNCGLPKIICKKAIVIRLNESEKIQDYLKHKGIGTLIHYPIPPYKQKAYKDLYIKPNDYPIANQLAEEVLSLPIGPHLSDEDSKIVINAINKF